jgi:hypothetical protein
MNAEADQLETSLPARKETVPTQDAVRKVVQALRQAAGQIGAGQDGDGPVTQASRCGICPIAFAVERHVTSAYQNVVLPPQGGVRISYKTSVTPDIHQELAPFNVGGKTRIDTAPSLVEILVKKGTRLLARDFWQLAYIFHHELVCHAFQGASVIPAPRKNASANCHWTEGWMDAVAFALSRQWARCQDCKPCFSFGGTAAISEMDEMYQTRYPKTVAGHLQLPAGLDENDAYLRLNAREAFDVLIANLELVNGAGEAEEMAIEFSLRLNAHQDVDLHILRQLSFNLQSALLNDIRPEAAKSAVVACLNFAATGNLTTLQKELAEAA